MSIRSDNFESTYDELRKQDGKLWLRILGQTHWQFDELPFWILLKDREQIKEALAFLQKSMRPLQNISNVDITVSFITFENNLRCSHGYFKGEDFFRPTAIDEIYEKPSCRPREASVFDDEYPNDPWAMTTKT